MLARIRLPNKAIAVAEKGEMGIVWMLTGCNALLIAMGLPRISEITKVMVSRLLSSRKVILSTNWLNMLSP